MVSRLDVGDIGSRCCNDEWVVFLFFKCFFNDLSLIYNSGVVDGNDVFLVFLVVIEDSVVLGNIGISYLKNLLGYVLYFVFKVCLFRYLVC